MGKWQAWAEAQSEPSPVGSEKQPESRDGRGSPLPKRGQQEGRGQESDRVGGTHSLATGKEELLAEELLALALPANTPEAEASSTRPARTPSPPALALSRSDCPQRAPSLLSSVLTNAGGILPCLVGRGQDVTKERTMPRMAPSEREVASCRGQPGRVPCSGGSPVPG